MKFNSSIDTDRKGAKVWFSSDFHLGHENIIKFSNRPYTMEENIKLVFSELDKIKPKDYLILLGDIVWKTNSSLFQALMSKINQDHLMFILGNHDKESFVSSNLDATQIMSYGRLEHISILRDKIKYELSLCHYPILSWNGKSRGALMLHGHCHGNLDRYNDSMLDLRADIGWDSEIGKDHIVEFDEILRFFYKKTRGLSFKDYVANSYKDLNTI